MRILATGATGFIGTRLIARLMGDGHRILAVTRREGSIGGGASVEEACCVGGWPGVAAKIAEFQPEVVIHLAALLTSKEDFDDIDGLIDSNIAFGTKLLRSLRGSGARRFVYSRSSAEFLHGDGVEESATLYAATKTAFRGILGYYAGKYGLEVADLVLYSIYGGRDSQKKAIDHIGDSFRSAAPSRMSGGEQALDFIHVDDVVEAIVAAVLAPGAPGAAPYHVGTGRGSSLREVAAIFARILGKDPRIEWGALPYRERETFHSVAPLRRFAEYTGWKPRISLEEGIAMYIRETGLDA